METDRALLLIADIGGYTEYMRGHRTILGHAEAATRRMLEKVVDAARGFDLIEIEGDAAFLSREADGLDDGATSPRSPRPSSRCTSAFHAERKLVARTSARATAARRRANLKLKFVAHVGEVATQKIRRRRKLVGMDVIHVHRLLKNPVEVPEYILFSEELYRSGGHRAVRRPVHEISHDLEGIGPVRAYYVDVEDLPGPRARAGALVGPSLRRDGEHPRRWRAVEVPPARYRRRSLRA